MNAAFLQPTGPRSLNAVDDVIQRVIVLRFCERTLRERFAGSSAWLWRMKHKVAVYCLRGLERRLADEGFVVPDELELTELERDQVLRTHPLLIDSRPRVEPFPVAEEWMSELRRRVAQFVDHLNASRRV